MKEHKIEILPITSDGLRILVDDISVEISNTAMNCFGMKSIDDFNISEFIDYIQENARNGFSIRRDDNMAIESISVFSDRLQGNIRINDKTEIRIFVGGDDLCKKYVKNSNLAV